MKLMITKDLTQEERDLFANLSDWKWRIQNLYYIKDERGRKVLFKPNLAQRKLMDDLWYFSIILKARQLGMTTFFCILYLDQVLFNSHKVAGIIAHKQDDAKRFFNDKVKFAWENIPPALKETIGSPSTDSAGELSWPNGSKIFVSTSVRSATLQFLHVSEFGKICAAYPKKAKEIVTGSINAVHSGSFVTIESTAEGRQGYFYDFCQKAEAKAKEGRQLSPLEFKFFFFPWWENPNYTLEGADITITKEDEDYFKRLRDEYNIVLSQGQKKWYVNKKETNEEDMYREYPSVPDEAFLVSIQGAYYTNQMAKVREENRICNIPYDASIPVETWWDLGVNDENVILFTQRFGNEIRFIDFYSNHGEGLGHYINKLHEKGYTFSRHVFPHDINVTDLGTGISRRKTLMDLGLRNIHTVKRTPSVNDDIEGVRKLFSRFYFDKTRCQKIVEALTNYRREWDDRVGDWKDRPRHDKNSHIADAVRLLVHAWSEHSLSNNEEIRYDDFF